MVALEMSCNPEKLRRVMSASRQVLKGFHGLTAEDKEDILLDVLYRFEVDRAKFPVSVYARHCYNKVVGFLGKKTAKKRMAQKEIDGQRVYFMDISLDKTIGEEEDSTVADTIPYEDQDFKKAELLVDVERNAPQLYPLFIKAIEGQKLTYYEKTKIRSFINSQKDL